MATINAKKFLYIVNTLKSLIQLNSELCWASIDIEVKISIMTNNVCKKFNLLLPQKYFLELVNPTKHKPKFIDIYKDIDMLIDNLNIFVAKNADHILVLGTLFLIRSQAYIDWEPAVNLAMACQSANNSQIAVAKVLKKNR